MIQANELRIGNYILYLNELYVVDGLRYEENASDLWRVTFRTVDGKLRNAKMLSWIKPVPLVPETLENAGFELLPWGYVKKAREDFGVRLNIKTFNYDVSGNSPVKVKYVHQLQNLYFALTGEELSISDCFLPQ